MHSVRWSFSYKSVFISGWIIRTTNSDSDSFLCTDWETNVNKESLIPGDDNTVSSLWAKYGMFSEKRWKLSGSNFWEFIITCLTSVMKQWAATQTWLPHKYVFYFKGFKGQTKKWLEFKVNWSTADEKNKRDVFYLLWITERVEHKAMMAHVKVFNLNGFNSKIIYGHIRYLTH